MAAAKGLAGHRLLVSAAVTHQELPLPVPAQVLCMSGDGLRWFRIPALLLTATWRNIAYNSAPPSGQMEQRLQNTLASTSPTRVRFAVEVYIGKEGNKTQSIKLHILNKKTPPFFFGVPKGVLSKLLQFLFSHNLHISNLVVDGSVNMRQIFLNINKVLVSEVGRKHEEST